MPMQTEKPEEFPDPTESLQDELLLPGRGDSRCPARNRHLHASSDQRPASHQITYHATYPIERPDFSYQLKLIGALGQAQRRRITGADVGVTFLTCRGRATICDAIDYLCDVSVWTPR